MHVSCRGTLPRRLSRATAYPPRGFIVVEDGEHAGRDRVDRRAFLQAVPLAAGAGLVSGRADGTGQPLETGVYAGPEGIGGRSLVVYRRPTEAERTICNTEVSWRHRVVAPPRSDDEESIYGDLYAPRRYPAGTVLALVDRLSACPASEEWRLYLRRVASPE